MKQLFTKKTAPLITFILACFLGVSLLTTSCATISGQPDSPSNNSPLYSLDGIPAYSGSPYVEINNNIPEFSELDKSRGAFEYYSPLDYLGRCGSAFILAGPETMPTEDRKDIDEIKPTGWHSVRYDGIVDGGSLYNRCHLLGFQISGENANDRNLITGTRYMNSEGMLPFEDAVADYIRNTSNHVLFRVTPLFTENNLVADGVQMEAYSLEDAGRGVSFNIFCYNVQPGITIDYTTGESHPQESISSLVSDGVVSDYILNTSSMKFHYPNCFSIETIKPANREDYRGYRKDLITRGYSPCGNCNP